MGLINLPKNIYSTTWAARPTASTMTGKIVRFSDVGYGSGLFISNGTRWQPLGGSCMIAQSNVASSVTGTSAETFLATIPIPAGFMSANGILEISSLWNYTNAATSRNLRCRVGQTTAASSILSSTATTTTTAQMKFYLRNANSVSSQVCQPIGFIQTYTTSTSTSTSYSIDTSLDFNVYFSATLTDTSQTVTLESYTIFYTEG